jgi:hypothetical protein
VFSELDVDAGQCGLISGEQFTDVDAEVEIGGDGVDDGRRQWTAQGEVVLDEQIPPRCDDLADGLGEGLRFAERPLELDEDLGERDIHRLGHELCLAAGEVAPERASRAAGVSDDLAESDPVDAAFADEHCGAFHHARAGR